MKKAPLIVIEGIDGAGKTTIAKWLVEWFREKGLEALYTFEPTDSWFVDALKKYSDIRSAELDALTYAADRIVHLRREVIPALENGVIVVMDRYYYSSMAYQGAQGAPVEWVREINRYALEPDIAVYIDVDPETGLSRLKKGVGRRFPEYEKVSLLKKVRSIYLDLVEKGYLLMVDGRKSIDEVKKDVLKLVLSRLSSFSNF